MPYRFKSLPPEPFAPYFAMSETELAAQGARIVTADEKPGFPCRVSLEDAESGERLLLLAFEHQAAHSPYRASGPVFIREGAQSFAGEAVPPVLRGRLLSLRAYDAAGCMVDADVIEGAEVESLLDRLFARPDTAEIHIHYARRGCFACRVERVFVNDATP
jgi:uncharacterized protein DUF1203